MCIIYDTVIHSGLYIGFNFVYPLCLLIVYQNDFPDFIALRFLVPSLNLRAALAVDICRRAWKLI